MDHVVPRSQGGGSGVSNLVSSCSSCNGLKADMSLDEFRSLRLSQTPQAVALDSIQNARAAMPELGGLLEAAMTEASKKLPKIVFHGERRAAEKATRPAAVAGVVRAAPREVASVKNGFFKGLFLKLKDGLLRMVIFLETRADAETNGGQLSLRAESGDR